MRCPVVYAISLLALAGCATEIAPTADATGIPPVRIHAPAYTKPSADHQQGLVIVKRDKPRPMSINCRNDLFVDGTHVATIEPSEKIEIYLSLGEHIVGASKPNCGGEIREVTITPNRSITKTIRVWSDRNGNLQVQQTSF